MDLEDFIQAQHFFSELCSRAGQAKEAIPVPPHCADRYFGTAAYACAVLYSLEREQLLSLEKEGMVHSSTLSGGSLPKAMRVVNDYLTGNKSAFDWDEYEQLIRTCDSASHFLSRCRGNYNPGS